MLLTKPLLIALAAAAMIVMLQTWRLDKAQTELALYEVAVEQCKVTNTQNVGAIRELELAGQLCVAGREADEKLFDEVETRWELERGFLAERSKATTEQRIEVYRDPTCTDFATMDIRNICPALVDSLRRQAQSLDRVRSRGEDRSGASGDSG